ncbi:MAG: 1-acyl-sn-glycerol-3-phosphate acyltransferase [Chloroflexi bacterium]|nr:1-acyl-sn-glycerol-3-phosphate acyltransferase [Chloroflexota bacterium]
MGESITTYRLPKTTGLKQYDHARREPMRRFLRWLMDQIAWTFLVKIKAVEGLDNFPMTGPAILMINHIAFVDPVVVMGHVPRNIVPMAKVEVYKIPGWGIFPRLWDVIPVHREELDRRALERAIAVLNAGEIILVAPEGTRHSAMRDTKEGLAYLALKTGAPTVPIAITGTPGFPRPRFMWGKREGAVVRIGKPFRFKPVTGRPPRELLRKMTDEAMYIIAAMLPEELRGEYNDLGKATRETIEG